MYLSSIIYIIPIILTACCHIENNIIEIQHLKLILLYLLNSAAKSAGGLR